MAHEELIQGKIVIHNERIDDVSTHHLALFLNAATATYATARKMLEMDQFPIHIIVEMDGTRVCGTVEPCREDQRGELTIVPLNH